MFFLQDSVSLYLFDAYPGTLSYSRLASNSYRTADICLLSTGIKGLSHHHLAGYLVAFVSVYFYVLKYSFLSFFSVFVFYCWHCIICFKNGGNCFYKWFQWHLLQFYEIFFTIYHYCCLFFIVLVLLHFVITSDFQFKYR